MVQEFHVVRCFCCQSFQVHQVKKVNRWSCTLCGQKQSVLKEFGRGSGADCRRHVQKLNSRRGAMLEEREQTAWSLWMQTAASGGGGAEEQQGEDDVTPGQGTNQISRWSKYLNVSQEAEPEENAMGSKRLCRSGAGRWADGERTPEQALKRSLTTAARRHRTSSHRWQDPAARSPKSDCQVENELPESGRSHSGSSTASLVAKQPTSSAVCHSTFNFDSALQPTEGNYREASTQQREAPPLKQLVHISMFDSGEDFSVDVM